MCDFQFVPNHLDWSIAVYNNVKSASTLLQTFFAVVLSHIKHSGNRQPAKLSEN